MNKVLGEPTASCRQAFRSSAFAPLFHSSGNRFHFTTLRAAAILLAFALLTFSGCNKKTDFSASDSASKSSEEIQSVDYDLTKMNANMVYATVFDMMIDSEKYADKRLKMKGNFESYGDKIYAVIISDALACCQQGIEFHFDFKNSEPKKGKVITVTGVFKCTEMSEGVSYNFVEAETVE